MRGSGSSEGGGLSDFIDGLGPGQLVGRQLLGATTLGDVQLSMCYQKGFLEVKKYKYIFLSPISFYYSYFAVEHMGLRKFNLYFQVEVIRARGLQARQGSRTLPAPYVKVYLVSGKRCIAKAKTTTARRTLDPLYQQTLTFRENFKGCVLQVTKEYFYYLPTYSTSKKIITQRCSFLPTNAGNFDGFCQRIRTSR